MRHKQFVAALAALLLLTATAHALERDVTHQTAESKRLTIVDENGAALVGATVVVGEFNRQVANEVKSTLQSDARGEVSFPLVKGGWLLVWAKGKALGGSYLNSEIKLEKLVLRAAQPVRLRFVDTKNAPIAGVSFKVLASNVRSGDFKETVPVRATQQEVPFPVEFKSDETGWITLPSGAKESRLWGNVEKSGFQSIQAALSVSADEGLTVRLVPDAKIEGRFVSATTNKPLAKTRFSFRPFSGWKERAQQTDANGHFLIEGMDETNGYIELEDQSLVLPADLLTTKRGQSLNVGDLKASAGCLVRGSLKLDGKALYNASLSVFLPDKSNGAQGPMTQFFQQVEVSPTGEYSVRLPKGKFLLTGSMWGGNPARATREIEATEGSTLNVDLELKLLTPQDEIKTAPPEPVVEGERIEYLSGETVAVEDGSALAGVKVNVLNNGELVRSGVSNAQGLFAIGPLPLEGDRLPATYTVVVEAPYSMAAPVLVPATSDKHLKLMVGRNQPLVIQAVDSEGVPVPDASITVSKFRFAVLKEGSYDLVNDQGGMQLPQARGLLRADANGLATLADMPWNGFVEIKTFCRGFSDGIFMVALPRKGPVTLKLPRETIIGGRLMFGDEGPVPGLGIQVKTQSWGYPWGEYEQWRISEVKKDGSFEVHNVPSLEQVGEDSYTINLQADNLPMGSKRELAPGITASYVNGWNLMLTFEKAGVTQHWVSFVEAEQKGLRYTEGDYVKHDMVFQPMAILKGTLPKSKEANDKPPIFYTNPHSIYGYWIAEVDKDGHFELPVNVGSVTVTFPEGERTFTNLKAHEVRTVEFEAPAVAPDPAAAQPATNQPLESLPIVLRVLGPDGVTVPRPILQWSAKRQQSYSSGGPVLGRMDGIIEVDSLGNGATTLDITSDYLDKPLHLEVPADTAEATVRFDRVPETVPSESARPDAITQRAIATVAGTDNQKAPETLAIGDLVTSIEAGRWISGGPVSLEKLRGRVVLVSLSATSTSTIARVAARFRESPVTIIHLTNRESEAISFEGATAIGIDKPYGAPGRGYTATRFGINYEGVAVIDRNGKLAASNLTAPYLIAKIEQLLEGDN